MLLISHDNLFCSKTSFTIIYHPLFFFTNNKPEVLGLIYPTLSEFLQTSSMERYVSDQFSPYRDSGKIFFLVRAVSEKPNWVPDPPLKYFRFVVFKLAEIFKFEAHSQYWATIGIAPLRALVKRSVVSFTLLGQHAPLPFRVPSHLPFPLSYSSFPSRFPITSRLSFLTYLPPLLPTSLYH